MDTGIGLRDEELAAVRLNTGAMFAVYGACILSASTRFVVPSLLLGFIPLRCHLQPKCRNRVLRAVRTTTTTSCSKLQLVNSHCNVGYYEGQDRPLSATWEAGQSTRGRFTTTIFCLNNGLVKLSQLTRLGDRAFMRETEDALC